MEQGITTETWLSMYWKVYDIPSDVTTLLWIHKITSHVSASFDQHQMLIQY
jgi:hypothetical protein